MKTVFVGLLMALVLGSCSLAGTNAPPAQARSFTVTVTGSTASTGTITVYEGDTVTITLSADKAEEIHLHGYDIHFEPAPGKPDTHTFKADKTGTFEYEIEASSTHLGNLIVQPR